ncbi:hypothetical protein [Streptomyces sp. NPDC052042]|uniref:hypothetical protein n=1 Tax=Streptomyces sp. NPDC052042 TaxID=3365683 RepID=UPI0037D7F1F3
MGAAPLVAAQLGPGLVLFSADVGDDVPATVVGRIGIRFGGDVGVRARVSFEAQAVAALLPRRRVRAGNSL